MTFCVDRIEGETVFLVGERGKTISLPRRDIPFGTLSEGDILGAVKVGRELIFTCTDGEEKDARLNQVREKLNKFKSGGKTE